MSLATRCTACSTVFRVVEDQLKVSQGWVRCGRCNEVFDAQANLVEVPLPRPAEPVSPVSPIAPVAPELDVAAAVSIDEAAAPEAPAPDLQSPARGDSPNELRVFDEPPAHPESDPARELEPGPTLDTQAGPASASEDAVSLATDLTEAVASEPAAAISPMADLDATPADLRGDSVTAVPSFIRKADRAARWQHKSMRAALAVAALCLSLLLAAQLAVSQRDWLATRWPQSRPWLDELCQPLGCRVQALRRVDQINVAASGLTRIEGSPLYRFNMVLLNRGDLALMMPAIDLSLTDAQGQVIARRVLSASELGVLTAVVIPGTELPLQAMLSTGSRRVAGYTIELFYP